MAFEGLSGRLSEVFKKLKGRGKVKESDIKEVMREVRMALLEADVNYKVAKDFVASVSEKAMGSEVLESLTPAQQIIKIVNQELTALMGGLPTATYSQNVGIVTTNKVVNRTVFAIAGGFLLLAGISPKFAALLTTIPQCVLGGATVTVFSTIAMTGMKLIASQDLTARNTTIVGLSAALGVGISQASEALSQFPEAFTMVFGQSPVVIATIMAVLLNLILPKEK